MSMRTDRCCTSSLRAIRTWPSVACDRLSPNGTPTATIQLLDGIAAHRRDRPEVRETARSVAVLLVKKPRAK